VTGALREKATPRRADARKNIAAILDAATACLARDPDVSINEIAKAAGVGRVTLYGHFETRSGLVAAVVERAMAETEESLTPLDLTGDPREALARLLDATWHLTHRFGALVVAAQQVLPPDQLRESHERPTVRVERLLRRGRRGGVFRADMPLGWQVTVIHTTIHAASTAVHRGEITADQAPRLIRDTVLAALAATSDQ
jgi:TetR/AcrR family transcriptional repressor of mexCD-oprJ operon